MTPRGKLLLSRIGFAVYLAVVAFLCFGTFSDVHDMGMLPLGIPADKVVHFCMFLPFVPLCCLSWDPGKVFNNLVFVFAAFAVGAVVAASTEIIQCFIPYREMNAGDFLADAIGLAAGSFATLMWKPSKSGVK